LKSPILSFSLTISLIIFEPLYDGIDILLVNLFVATPYTSDVVSSTDSYMFIEMVILLVNLFLGTPSYTSDVVSSTDSYMFIEMVILLVNLFRGMP